MQSSLFRRPPVAPAAKASRIFAVDNGANDADDLDSLESLDSMRSYRSESLESLSPFSPMTPDDGPMSKSSGGQQERRLRSWRKNASARSSSGSIGRSEADPGIDGVGSVGDGHVAGEGDSATTSAGRGKSKPFRVPSASKKLFSPSPKRLFKGSSSTAFIEATEEQRVVLKTMDERVPTTPSLPVSTIKSQSRQQARPLSPLTPVTTAAIHDSPPTETAGARAVVDGSTPRTMNGTMADAFFVEGGAAACIQKPFIDEGAGADGCQIAEAPSTVADEDRATEMAAPSADPSVRNSDSSDGSDSASDTLGENSKMSHSQIDEEPNDGRESASEVADESYGEFLNLIGSANGATAASEADQDEGAEKPHNVELSPGDREPMAGESPIEIVSPITEKEEAAEREVRSLSAGSDETDISDGDVDGDDCRCLWCPQPLFALLRGGGSGGKSISRSAVILLLPQPRHKNTIAETSSNLQRSVDSLKVDLNAMVVNHDQAMPSAHMEMIISEISVIKTSLDKISLLSVDSSWKS